MEINSSLKFIFGGKREKVDYDFKVFVKMVVPGCFHASTGKLVCFIGNLHLLNINTEWFGPLSLGNRSFLDGIVASTDLNESDYNDSSIFIQYDLEKISISNRLSPFKILKRLLSRKSSHFFHRPREKIEKHSKKERKYMYFMYLFYETKI